MLRNVDLVLCNHKSFFFVYVSLKVVKQDTKAIMSTRWALTSHRWSYSNYKLFKQLVIGVISPICPISCE